MRIPHLSVWFYFPFQVSSEGHIDLKRLEEERPYNWERRVESPFRSFAASSLSGELQVIGHLKITERFTIRRGLLV